MRPLILASVLGLVPLTACKPCPIVPDPDCDWHVPDNHCGYVCAQNVSESGETNAADTDSVDSGIRDGDVAA